MPPGLHYFIKVSRHPLSAQPPEDGQLAGRRIVNPVLLGGCGFESHLLDIIITHVPWDVP